MQTTSKNNSASTSASVLMINAQGIMLSVLGHDYFLSYNRIPWMQDAPIRSVLNVQMSGPEAIEWPDLDGWTVCWLDGTIDIAPEHLYELGVAA